jgi:hypothetical protein
MKFFLYVVYLIPLQSWAMSQKSECSDHQVKFEGKCVKLPKHAIPMKDAPGWRCETGYTVAQFECKKVSIPKHATLSEDGIAWTCNEGYVPYRGTCIKDSKK